MGSQCESGKESSVSLCGPPRRSQDTMKYLVALVLLVGFACGSEEEETSLQDLSEMEEFDDFTPSGRTGTLDPMLLVGNVVSALNNLNGTDINGLLASLGGLGAAGGTIATGTLLKNGLTALKTAIVGIIAMPVGIANTILALVGLVLLIIFLIDGGDFGSLLGVARSMPTFEFPSFDLVHNPVVESISDMFFKAMEKYDN